GGGCPPSAQRVSRAALVGRVPKRLLGHARAGHAVAGLRVETACPVGRSQTGVLSITHNLGEVLLGVPVPTDSHRVHHATGATRATGSSRPARRRGGDPKSPPTGPPDEPPPATMAALRAGGCLGSPGGAAPPTPAVRTRLRTRPAAAAAPRR